MRALANARPGRTGRALLAVGLLAVAGCAAADLPESQQQYQLRAADDGQLALTQVQVPVRRPESGEVVVRVRAVSLNRRDLLVAAGQYGTGMKEDVVPLSDGAGEVVAVGEGVSRFDVGDRVAAIFFSDWIDGRMGRQSIAHDRGGSIDGMLSQYVTLHEDELVSVPDYMTYEEAATLPCAAVTAWNGLVTRGRLREGDRVLLLGTGGVSVFGLQMALALGAEPIITSSSDEKLARMRELGAELTINYRDTPEWHEAVLEMTGGEGVHHVLEVGGRGTLERSLASIAPGGHVALIGALDGGPPGSGIQAGALMFANQTVSGIYVGSREHFEAMNEFLAEHELRPVIDRVFDFDDAQAAYDYMASSEHVAKIVIRL